MCSENQVHFCAKSILFVKSISQQHINAGGKIICYYGHTNVCRTIGSRYESTAIKDRIAGHSEVGFFIATDTDTLCSHAYEPERRNTS